jgi:hypothetical protein
MEYILRTFNALDPEVAANPDSLLSRTSDFLKSPLTSHQISRGGTSRFYTTAATENSEEEVLTTLAATAGLSGSYGFFSASVNASAKSTKVQTATSFNFSFAGHLFVQNRSFIRPTSYPEILSCMTDNFRNALESIKTFSDAENFTETYGTHVITSVDQGGCLFLNITAQTSSESSDSQLSTDLTAEYKGVTSITATASVMQHVASKYSSASITQEINALGGDPALAAQIDPTEPETFSAWEASCKQSDSFYAVAVAVEVWKLATDPAVQALLEIYVNATVLVQSIKHPSFFQTSVQMTDSTWVSVAAAVPDGYRIIAGGAGVDGFNNFLTGSYPDMGTFDKEIVSWHAEAHDAGYKANPDESLTAYAIAVYDPKKILDIGVSKQHGSNTGAGSDTCKTPAPDGYFMTGGGVQTIVSSGAPKWIQACYPDTGSDAGASWVGVVADHIVNATDVQLVVYSVGIAVDDDDYKYNIGLVPSSANSSTQGQKGGNTSQILSGLCSGGGKLTHFTGPGNLIKSIVPVSANQWQVGQGDNRQASNCDVTAYAISLKASFDTNLV